MEDGMEEMTSICAWCYPNTGGPNVSHGVCDYHFRQLVGDDNEVEIDFADLEVGYAEVEGFWIGVRNTMLIVATFIAGGMAVAWWLS
jgi:hypothetical protein